MYLLLSSFADSWLNVDINAVVAETAPVKVVWVASMIEPFANELDSFADVLALDLFARLGGGGGM